MLANGGAEIGGRDLEQVGVDVLAREEALEVGDHAGGGALGQLFGRPRLGPVAEALEAELEQVVADVGGDLAKAALEEELGERERERRGQFDHDACTLATMA